MDILPGGHLQAVSLHWHIFFIKIFPVFKNSFFLVKELYDKWNFWIVFTAGFTPLPYKVFTITRGAFNINFAMLLIASVISRSARFFLVTFLIWKFGAEIKGFIDEYFNLPAILFTVLLIGGFLLIKCLL